MSSDSEAMESPSEEGEFDCLYGSPSPVSEAMSVEEEDPVASEESEAEVLQPEADPGDASTMDVISLGARGSIYRAHGSHGYVKGRGGVVSVTTGVDHKATPACLAFPVGLCGKVSAPMELFNPPEALRFVNSAFHGSKYELYHLEGVLQVYQHNVQFKGVEGTAALREVLKTLSTFCDGMDLSGLVTVHNAVFTFRLGKLVNTAPGGYFEQQVCSALPGVIVIGQPFEDNQCVKLKVESSEVCNDLTRHFPANAVPTVVDFRVAWRGVVQARISWIDCPWDQPMEDTVKRYLDGVAVIFRECC